MRIFKEKSGTAMAVGAIALVSGLWHSAEAKPKKTVLGFYASWSPPTVRYDKITHLMYAFLTPGGSGDISGSVPGNIISEAHSNGVKVIASIGGSNNSSGYPSLAASSSGRSAFANACKSIVNGGADGVDIDWEFPANGEDSANLTLLLKAVRNAIGPTKLISIELAPNDEKGKWVSKSALDIADYYSVMAFDFTGDFPGSPVGQPSSYQQSVIGIYYWWRNRGVTQSKVVLGVPFYGKNFDAGGTAVDYKDIMSANPGLPPDADQIGKTWFNGVTTMTKKATYVAQNGYGGIMIWQLDGDVTGSKSLLDAVNTGLAAPEVSVAPALPSARGGYASGPALTRLGFPGSARQRNGTQLRILDLTGRSLPAARLSGTAPAAGFYAIDAASSQPQRAKD